MGRWEKNKMASIELINLVDKSEIFHMIFIISRVITILCKKSLFFHFLRYAFFLTRVIEVEYSEHVKICDLTY
jgi:hypothetical protein